MKMIGIALAFVLAVASASACASQRTVQAQSHGVNSEGLPVAKARIPGVASITYIDSGKQRILLIKDEKGADRRHGPP